MTPESSQPEGSAQRALRAVLDAEKDHESHAPTPATNFEEILTPAEGPSTQVLVHPDAPSAAPVSTSIDTEPSAKTESRSSRLFHKIGFSSSSKRGQENTATPNPSKSTDTNEPPPSRKPHTESRALAIAMRKEQRIASIARAKEHRLAKREAEREERARTQWLGGLAWGFDPEAGHTPQSAQSAGNDDGRGRDKRREVDEGSSRPRSRGIEAGGPGNEGRFGYGLLVTRDAELFRGGKDGQLRLRSVGGEGDGSSKRRNLQSAP